MIKLVAFNTSRPSIMVIQISVHVVGVKHLVLNNWLTRLSEHVFVHLHLLYLIDGLVHSFVLVWFGLPWLIGHRRFESLHLRAKCFVVSDLWAGGWQHRHRPADQLVGVVQHRVILSLQVAHVVLSYLLHVFLVAGLNILFVYVKQIESNNCFYRIGKVEEILLCQHLNIALEVNRVVHDALYFCYGHVLQKFHKSLIIRLCPDDVSTESLLLLLSTHLFLDVLFDFVLQLFQIARINDHLFNQGVWQLKVYANLRYLDAIVVH